MRHNVSRIFAWMMTIAMLVTTFGSDFASIRTFAEEANVIVAEEQQAPVQEETAPVDTVQEQPQEENTIQEETPVQEEVAEVNQEETPQTPNVESQESAPVEVQPASDGATVDNSAVVDEAVSATSASSEDNADVAVSASSEDVAADIASTEASVEEEEVIEEKIVTITYKATLGGSVSRSEEKVDINKGDAKFEGAVASAKRYYNFLYWKNENGDIVCYNAEFAPGEVTEDATFTAYFEKTSEMPAQSFTGGAGGIHVEVSADEGIFPAGTTMVVTPVSSEVAMDAATAAVGDSAKDAVGVDISFRNAEGEEIEPADSKNVHVVLKLQNELEGDNFAVVHKDDTGNVEEIAQASADGAEFDHNQFSIFIVVSTNEDDHENNAVATYTFYTDESLTTEFNKQSVKTGDKLSDPGIPSISTGEEFEGWFYEKDGEEVKLTFDGTALTVDKTEEYKVYAKIRTTYYVTFIGASGEVAYVKRVEAEKGKAAPTSITNGYTPKKSTQAFLGWSLVKDDQENIRTEVDASIEAERTLYAIVVDAFWIHFEENDDVYEDGVVVATGGASYTSPIYVMNGKKATQPADPTREGYSFNGWFYGTKNDDGSVTLGEKFDWDTIIDEDITLYGSWTANSTTKYTVIIWQQKVTDSKSLTDDSAKTYDYKASYTLEGETDSTITESDIASYESLVETGFHYSWFEIIRMKNGVKTPTDKIRPQGDTVVNVYYDRDLITIEWWYYSNKTWHNDYPSYTGLYGQTLEFNNYTWPNTIGTKGYDWYTSYSEMYGEYSHAGTHVTFLDTFFENQILFGFSGSNGSNYIRHYKQDIYGNYASNPTNYTIEKDAKWTFTNKYNGFTVKEYYHGKNYPTNSSRWTQTSDGESISMTNNLYIHYERNKYALIFKDNFQGVTSTVSADEKYDAIPYEMPLTDYEADAPKLADRPGYTFVGWYEDQNGQTPFDWSSTMPAANKVVYAYYQPVRYNVILHPDGGTLAPTQSDDFNLDYGDSVSQESLNKTTKAGFELIGWFDAENNAYSFDKITGPAVSQDENGVWWGAPIHLYASWRNPGTISVYYEAGEHGSIATQPDTYTYASNSSAVVGPPPTTIDSEYIFIGWTLVGEAAGKTYYPNNSFVLADGTIEYNDPENSTHGTVTLLAKYEKIGGPGSNETTTITYVANNGTTDTVVVSKNAEGKDLRVNESVVALDADTFTYEGYEFVEWNTAADGSGYSVPAGTEYIAADNKDSATESTNTKANKLYAIWQKTYKITYELTVPAGETATTPAEVTGLLDGDTRATAAAPEITGYIFDGWYNDNTKVTPGNNVTIQGADILLTGSYIADEFDYTVKHLDKADNSEIATADTGVKAYGETLAAAGFIKEDITGYTYDSDTGDITISADATANVITIYYSKKNNLEYTVNYLEKGTNAVLETPKTVGNKTFGDTVTENAITITGYALDGDSSQTITIAETGNVINFYYVKKTNLKYTVHYYVDGTTTTVPGLTDKEFTTAEFGKTYTENATPVTGYDIVSAVDQDGNKTEGATSVTVSFVDTDADLEVIFYYALMTDLSYTVNYLENGTNAVLKTPDTVTDQTFGDTVSVEPNPDKDPIDGYTRITASPQSLTIAVTGNVVNFYYEKRTDYDYVVHYYKEGTTTKVAADKEVNNKTYNDEFTEKAIAVDGYTVSGDATKTFNLDEDGKEIIFYYVEREDLSYTVEYRDADTDETVADTKSVANVKFGSTQTEKAIEVVGYELDESSEEEQSIVIGTDLTKNVIIFYYKKRADLKYIVHYYEEGTTNTVSPDKEVAGQTFKASVTEEAIAVDGYTALAPTSQTITIAVETEEVKNEIIFYYAKRTDLEYTVHYYLEGTTTKVQADKVVEDQTFGDTVTETPDDISGYYIVDDTAQTITISATETNEIIFYYNVVRGVTLQAIGGSTTYSAEEHNVEGFVVNVAETHGVTGRIAGFFSNLFGLSANAANVSEKEGDNTFTIDGVTYTVEGITSTAKGTDAGTYPTAFEGTAVIKAGSEDVTDRFNISYETANLVIDKRNITFTSGTSSKTYDGSPLTNSNVAITGDGFAGSDSATFTVTGSQTATGSSTNYFTYVINGNENNYNVTKVEGTLTVTSAGGTTPTPPTTPPTATIPDAPVPLAPTPTAVPAVLGANREQVATEGPAVLGARRGRTDDTTNTGFRFAIIMVCAGAASILAALGKRKGKDAK
ncbi:MAG: InlB B-repeat-containing protein [Butyrivibrio sp.]|nr:InlB B-repeat-containing protein [Butyrivibrio sp.]